jgi:stringent starvation protein B
MSQAKADSYTHLLSVNYIVETHVMYERCDGLPEYLKGQQCLHIGLNLPIPIRTLSVTAQGIFADLSFSGRVHDVFMPWSAVVGVYAESMGAVPLEEEKPADPGDNVVRIDFKKRKRA